jgi:excisionase family DNA binding protein
MLVEKTEKPLAYTPGEAARLLNISLRKLTYLIGLREVRTFKIGKSRRVSADALQEYIKRQEKATR